MNTIKQMFRLITLLIVLFSITIISCEKESVDIESEIELLFPNEGGVFLKGGKYTISWVDEKSNSVRIKLYRSGLQIAKITDDTPNTGAYSWTCADSVSIGGGYTIKIFSNSDDFLYTGSEIPFSIIDKPSEYSSFIDIRDGQEYKTVKINNKWWMTQNFNFEQESYCYDNNPEICQEYGRLYTLINAKDLAPTGWHLPSDSEWKDLEVYLGVSLSEIDEEGYRGVNTGLLLKEGGGLGFDAKYSGYVSGYSHFSGLNEQTSFWTSTYNSRGGIYWARELMLEENGIKRFKTWANYNAFSVRYVKDE